MQSKFLLGFDIELYKQSVSQFQDADVFHVHSTNHVVPVYGG